MAGESISPLGNIGLGSSGYYSSYDPMMMAMMGGYGYGSMMDPSMSMMGGYGMGMGMMNPMILGAADATGTGNYMDRYMDYLQKYNEYAEKMEERKLQHATEMHRKSQLAEVANLSAHDQSFFLKAVEDGDVQHCVREMHDAIRRGNMDYVVKTFFELKQVIYNKFSDYFKSSDGNVNSDEKIKQYICILYSEIAGGYASSGGIKPDLKNDVLTYGETPWQHGFNKTYLGNSGHNQLNAEDALNQMFGTGINDAGSKAKAEKIGAWTARGAEVATAGAVGTVAGVTALGAAKFFTPSWVAKHCPEAVASNGLFKWGTKFKTWGKGVGLAAAGLDILWQMSRN